jgi:benzoate transport
MSETPDPRTELDRSAMTRLQIVVIAVTVGLNALDGYDILSISFASPGIAAAWGVSPAALGIVLSMELIGMGIGSLLLGGIADRVGRRPTVLWCLLVMSIGMLMATTATDAVQLSLWRIVTGLGIGGMLSSINALAAEYSSRARRYFCIAVMSVGYPLGGVVGGFFASRLLAAYDWRSSFYLGAALTVLFIPLFYFVVPESVHWLARKQPRAALERINAIFARMGRTAIASLPSLESDARRQGVADIFSPRLMAVTVVLTAAYFLHTITFYFVLKWVPPIVARFGFNPASAGEVLTWASVGGTIGCAAFGFLTLKLDLKRLTLFALVLAGIFVAVFGRTPADLAIMAALVTVAGTFCSAAVVGFYALMAQYFPTHARAFGTGFVLSVGRGGAALSPILAGILIGRGIGLPTVGAIMGGGSILALLVLTLLRRPAGEGEAAQTM